MSDPIADVLAAHAPTVGPATGSWRCPCGAHSTALSADGYPASRTQRAAEHRAHVADAIRARLLSDEVVNPYDQLDTCVCSAWSDSECGCGGFVDIGKVRAWQSGYDAARAALTTTVKEDDQ